MILVDTSDPRCDEQLEVTQKLLFDLDASSKPILYVYNKCDMAAPGFMGASSRIPTASVAYISAKTGVGINEMLETLSALCNNGKTKEVFVIPVSEQGMLNALYKYATVHDVEYGDEYVVVCATVDKEIKGRMKKYLKRRNEDEETEE